ncbi:MAG: TlpA family protein disulfide reductase [Acidimicrobiia bacterium]
MNPLHRSRRFVVGFVALAIVASACTSSNETDGQNAAGQIAQEAELAPDFMVPTASGGRFSLSEHLATDGRPVFLNLWASWCFPCREEMPAIDAASKIFTNVAFIGVAVQDSRSEANDFREEIGVSYEIGFDEDGAVDADYRPLGLPASYIISAEGLILERVFGKLTEEDLAEKLTKYFG